MALYNQLPVYQTSYQLLISIFQYATNFRKDYKYTLGEALKKETVFLITNIYRANSRIDKKALLQSARENIEVIRLYIRLLKDLKQINIQHFIAINQQIESVSKQLAGWHKSVKD